MNNDMIKLNVMIMLREDGSVEARCPDLGILIVADDYDKAIEELWRAMSFCLSTYSLIEVEKLTVKGLPYYGPSGGIV